jgi:tetratricopeptide (TPR) repeat protein
VWDSSGKQLAELTGHQDAVTSASFSLDGQRLVTASWDKTARVWDSSGKLLAELTGHQGKVYSASFSPDGQRILTASEDKTAREWRVESLEQLLARGCNWLNDYLITHPKDLETFAECQNKSNLMAAAPFLVKEGEAQATAGNIDEAITTFRKALKWNPGLQLDPEAEARRLAALGLARKQVEKAVALVRQGEVEQALAAYAEAKKLDPNLKISGYSWNILCWFGSLHGHAADVIDACEKAVALEPEDGRWRDSRGLARALSGNRAGAIEDFQAFVAWSKDEQYRGQRQRWINDLRAGKNPFTPEEIKVLLDE